jgi:uncharacterized membrane protein YwaF
VWLAFRKRPEQVREKLVIGLCAAATVLFLLEKYWLSLDAEYLATQTGGGFDVLSELPLHLCNVDMLLIPVALLSRRRALLAFCCLSAPLGALMALATPLTVFSGSSLLLLRNIGYYGTHSLLVVAGLGPFTLGLFRPAFRDLLPAVALLLAAQTAMHLVNTALRMSGASPGANYFFTYGPENSGILELLWGLAPIPFVYELPLLPAALAYGFLTTALIRRAASEPQSATKKSATRLRR